MPKKTTVKNFEIILEPEACGGYHVCAPALKGCHSYGATKEEAIANITEAVDLWLECAAELDIPVPQPDAAEVKRK